MQASSLAALAADRRVRLARTVLAETRARDLPTYAASLAYYAFVSLVPLLALAVTAAATLGGPGLEERVTGLAARYLLPTGRELVVEALGNTGGRGSTTVLGLAVLVWSGLKLFRGLDVAISRVYGTEPGGFVEQIGDGLLALVGVVLGTAAAALAAGAVAVVARETPLGLLVPVATLGVLVVAFLPLYYVFPDFDLGVREALPGAVFAAVAWTVIGSLFGAYAAYATSEGTVALYGLLGGLVLLVTWFYLAALVVLVGAVVNGVAAGHVGTGRLAED